MKWIKYNKLTADQKAELTTEFVRPLPAAGFEYEYDASGKLIARRSLKGKKVEAVGGKLGLDQTDSPSEPADSVAHVRYGSEKFAHKVEISMMRREDIEPWAEQPRRRFDPEKLEELVTSMRAHGFLEHAPLLVRRLITPPGSPYALRFEIVAGERRWRAAGVAGIETVPCIIRNLSDAEAHELAMVENLQRDDLTALEEAEGYQALLRLRSETGELVHSIASLSEKIGRSARHVSERLSLCRLRGEKAGAALEQGDLPYSQARLIASVQSRTLRDELTGRVLKNTMGTSPMPVKDLERILRDEYQRELRGVRFDQADAELLPLQVDAAGVRLAGGACLDCPHNTKNAVGEVPREGSKGARHMCLNPECYGDKEVARHERWRASVEDKNLKRSALPAEENAALFSGYDPKRLAWDSGYVELSGTIDCWRLLREGLDRDKMPTWGEITAGLIPVVIAEDREGNIHEVARQELAIEAARQARPDLFRKALPAGAAGADDEDENEIDFDAAEAARDRAKEKSKLVSRLTEKAIIEALLAAKNIANVWDALLLALMAQDEYYADSTAAQSIAEELGWVEAEEAENEENGADNFLLARVAEFPERQRAAIVVQLVLRQFEAVHEEITDAFTGALAVDLSGVEAAAEAQMAAKEQGADAVPAMELVWSRLGCDYVEDFEWVNGTCKNPDIAALEFPGLEGDFWIEVARGKKGWFAGWAAVFADGSKAGFCACETGTKYGTRALAARSALLELQECFETDASISGDHVTAIEALVEQVEAGSK
jgi:ParB/RepB/Spo0J family partition protein